MVDIHCRNPKCRRKVCASDGEKLRFEILDNFADVWIRGKSESVKCGCGHFVKIKKDLGLNK